MTESDVKADLRLYLQDARDALLLKLEGLSEYDMRRPLTPTGTNLLGLVKHMTSAEAVYFGDAFGRPFAAPGLWIAGAAEANSDFWARADESSAELLGRYRDVWIHSDATIAELPLDAVGTVPWGDRLQLPLRRILIHVITESQRHAGQADIVRELVDGVVGQRAVDDCMPERDGTWWRDHLGRVEQAAREASGDS
ncbi:DinB family protein [Kitasatospora sp. RB6PN24]|uniref:DinB family protein n=1 Tax=Kitasatospora humi TaxID=2893891 RepID=UPI001E4B7765|nr:DinB family protein [Kitasatospora humi]MCC9306247.1 DinB family protein [Kitasatospora humi]